MKKASKETVKLYEEVMKTGWDPLTLSEYAREFAKLGGIMADDNGGEPFLWTCAITCDLNRDENKKLNLYYSGGEDFVDEDGLDFWGWLAELEQDTERWYVQYLEEMLREANSGWGW